ncbi:hypothetical protein ACHAWO_010514 [Cyclotella atomus]|uniref:Ribosomal RNA-processing protein 14/surfeit locus protein 6 C-terminal domain-containing protein n=1 Tax=Cyclotella atomus TaxID=382360 RepID=A0ABD3Q8C9_9STRA
MPPQHVNQFELLAELESHNEFFDSVVNSIPAKLYVAGASDNDVYHSKYLKGQNKESKEAKRARKKRSVSGITEDGAPPANSTTSSALVSKRAARRAEKRKRQEAAKQRKKTAPSSVQERSEPQRVVNLGGSKFNEPTKKKAITSAADDLATIDYQSIAGLKKIDPKFDEKSLNPKVKKKSLEKLLADAERKQQRLKELKESSAAEDKEKARNIEWGEALKVSEGKNARKTDPKLLKKALKRKAKKKAASAKAWGARLDQAKDALAKKQQIRSHNLEARKAGGAVGANLSSKKIVEKDEDGNKDGEKAKRRRMGPHSGHGNRAGFEGKKQGGFINGDSAKGGAKGKQYASQHSALTKYNYEPETQAAR